jgi:hypothetical protein
VRRGEVLATDGDHLSLSSGAAGFITFADGSTLRFKGVERIETVQVEPTQSEPAQSGPAQVEPVNQAPGIVELSANAVYENAAAGTVVGVVSRRPIPTRAMRSPTR